MVIFFLTRSDIFSYHRRYVALSNASRKMDNSDFVYICSQSLRQGTLLSVDSISGIKLLGQLLIGGR